ncbi:RNA-guided endonuclease InsQ/TnpB family protein [Streptomyces sp. NPDC127066]|uniref:RNA-guided endonuclease InsQ/TnpB family protein n=1 Tax=Streptomyces sp. NPDC127066 TaxID=3347125 RepID=UPI00365EB70E
MQLRYVFRMYPEPGQRGALARAFGCARTVFNDAVRARRDARAAGERYPTSAVLSKTLITEAKARAERAWLAEVSQVVLQQALRDADAAYANFFASLKGERAGARVGEPRFRSRRDARQAVRFTANARWKITGGGRLLLPKIGEVAVKWSRVLPSTPSSVTVVKDAAGRYFASFVIETDPDADTTRMPGTDRTIGIDLGLTLPQTPSGGTPIAVLSDGTKIDSPRFLRRAEKKLKETQQDLARKQKGSKNREKARVKVARAHAKVADARREFLPQALGFARAGGTPIQLSTKLIRENQAVAVEDLAVRGLARTRMAKSVHDAGWSRFTALLAYKAERYGRTFIKIDRFEPTSQVCSTCGHRDVPKPLHVREWTCTACGTVHDRDVNAAKNVKQAAGLAVTACGARVRPGLVPAQREETGSHGIPTGNCAARQHSIQ